MAMKLSLSSGSSLNDTMSLGKCGCIFVMWSKFSASILSILEPILSEESFPGCRIMTYLSSSSSWIHTLSRINVMMSVWAAGGMVMVRRKDKNFKKYDMANGVGSRRHGGG